MTSTSLFPRNNADGGPFKPSFGLSGGVLLLEKVFLSRFRVVHFDLISSILHSWVTVKHQVPPLHRSSLCDDLLRSG
jgi:hypothetical protein